jgi:hypothetical protein
MQSVSSGCDLANAQILDSFCNNVCSDWVGLLLPKKAPFLQLG